MVNDNDSSSFQIKMKIIIEDSTAKNFNKNLTIKKLKNLQILNFLYNFYRLGQK